MRISNIKKIFFCGVFCLTGFFCFGQNDFSGMEMPQMPSMPSMPEISGMPQMPSIGGGFYKPEIPNVKNQNTKKGDDKTDSEKSESVISSNNSTDNFVANLLGSNANLTAQDISSLYDFGLFDDISSLTANANINSGTNVSTNVLLQQILTSLEELKQENKTKSDAEKQSQNNLQEDNHIFKSRNPNILRFKINGYNILDSIQTVFISKPENDGSFLLTADRIYYVNQKQRKETVYVLFKAIGSNGSSTTFQIEPEIVQDVKNQNSFVYKMAQRNDLTAKKTGNLVVINNSDKNMQIDMLIDIDA